jgi:hypothetical protein
MVCHWYFKRLERGFGHSNLVFDVDIWHFLRLGNCFGYFVQNLGDFFPVFWSPWTRFKTLGLMHALTSREC